MSDDSPLSAIHRWPPLSVCWRRATDCWKLLLVYSSWEQERAIGFCWQACTYCLCFSRCRCDSMALAPIEPSLKRFLQMLQWASKRFPDTGFNRSENWLFSSHLLKNVHFSISSRPRHRIPCRSSSSVSMQFIYHNNCHPKPCFLFQASPLFTLQNLRRF